MSRRWSYPQDTVFDSNGNQILCYITITGLKGTNVAIDKENNTFLVNVRDRVWKEDFKTLEAAKHYADPELTKNPATAKKSRKVHLMVDHEHGIFILRKNNGDIIWQYKDANEMINRIKNNYQTQQVSIKMTIWP